MTQRPRYRPDSIASRVVAAHLADPSLRADQLAQMLGEGLGTVRSAAHWRGLRLPLKRPAKRDRPAYAIEAPRARYAGYDEGDAW
jgi:hypothetical protein